MASKDRGLQEVEMDAIGNNGDLVNYAIAEHIETLRFRLASI